MDKNAKITPDSRQEKKRKINKEMTSSSSSSHHLDFSFEDEKNASSSSDDCEIIEKETKMNDGNKYNDKKDDDAKAKSMAKRVLVRLQTKYTNAITKARGDRASKNTSADTISELKKMRKNINCFSNEVNNGTDVDIINRLTMGGKELDHIQSQEVEERIEFEYEILEFEG